MATARPAILITLEDGSLGLPDPPSLPKLAAFTTRAEWEQAKVQHKVVMAERHEAQKWLHEQKRDRRLRVHPCEEAAKLTPEQKVAKAASNKQGRKERKLDKQAFAPAVMGQPSQVADEFMADQAARRAHERAAFEAECAQRLQVEAERKSGEANRKKLRASSEDRWHFAPRWWLDGGGTQEKWEAERAERYRRHSDAQTPPLPASHAEPQNAPTPLCSTHADCERCGELFRQVHDESVCSECAPQCGDRRPCDICSELFVYSPAQPDMCSDCLSAGPPPERE